MEHEDARIQAVLTLGGSLLDYLDQPRQPSSTLGTEPGLSRSREVPCSACGARGRVARGRPCASCPPRTGTNPRPPAFAATHGCTPCLGCDGTGWRRRRKGDPEYDAYAGAEIESDQGHSDRKRWEELQDLERRLAQTEAYIAHYEGRDDDVEVGWERRRLAQWRQGSYAELVLALADLERRWPSGYSLFWRHVVLGGYGRLTGRALDALLEVARLLAYELMPEQIKVPRALRGDERAADAKESLWRGRTAKHEQARRERDQRIIHQRFVLGWKVARIARYHALEERSVKRIIASASVATSAA